MSFKVVPLAPTSPDDYALMERGLQCLLRGRRYGARFEPEEFFRMDCLFASEAGSAFVQWYGTKYHLLFEPDMRGLGLVLSVEPEIELRPGGKPPWRHMRR